MKYDTTKHNLWWNNYTDAERHMLRHEDKNNSLKIMHNTRASRLPSCFLSGGSVTIRLHSTDIYRIERKHDDGDEFAHSVITLDSGGWHSVTTKDRINRFLPLGFRLVQRNWNWIIQEMEDGTYRDRELFFDGMQIKLELA